MNAGTVTVHSLTYLHPCVTPHCEVGAKDGRMPQTGRDERVKPSDVAVRTQPVDHGPGSVEIPVPGKDIPFLVLGCHAFELLEPLR